MGKLADATPEQRLDWRREGEAAEERARRKPRPGLPAVRKPKVIAAPLFNQEHCGRCGLMLSRGSLRNVLVDPKAPGMSGYVALCRRCIRTHEEEPA